jgi:hypothetical protein
MRGYMLLVVLSVGCAAPAVNLKPSAVSFAVDASPDAPSVRVDDSRVIEPVFRLAANADLANPTRSRVTLADGRVVVCWVHRDVEWGNRAFAQSFEADGTPRGQPVVISPREVDVIGAPEMRATGGDRAVASFAASTESNVELLAVSIEGL